MGSNPKRLPENQTDDEWWDNYENNVKQVKPIQEPANESMDCQVETAPLVPAGEYKMAYVEHLTTKTKSAGKLNIKWAMVDGESSGIILPAYYPVALLSSPKMFGPFRASQLGEYYEQICDLFPELIGTRSDRISPQRLKGKIVLCDRFLDSTRAYQGVDGKVSPEFLLGLEKVAVGDCMPDLTFLLDISAEAGMERAYKRRTSEVADRFEREGLDLHEARRRAFLDIAAQEPHRFEVLNADKKAQIIAAEISLAVTTKLMERQITAGPKR